MTFERLGRRGELVELLAAWHSDEWRHLYAEWDAPQAAAEFLSEPDGGLPVTFVCRVDGELTGSVSVVTNDLPDAPPEWNPWLASLFVVREWRGKGIGRALVERAIDAARAEGMPEIWCLTEERQAMFEKAGFERVKVSRANGWDVTVMRRRV